MSELTNISQVDVSFPITQNKFFNNFFTSIPSSFSSNGYDEFISFFENYTGNSSSAKNVAAAVIYTAKQQGLNPTTILNEFKQTNKEQLNTTLANILNYYRYNSSLLGIPKVIQQNQYILRSIIF